MKLLKIKYLFTIILIFGTLFQVSAQVVFADNFTTREYNRNDGTGYFSTDWIETGDNTVSASGNVQIFLQAGNVLGFINGPDQGILRRVNLNGATSASLSFDWTTSGLDADENGSPEELGIFMSSDNAVSFTQVGAGTIVGTNSDTFTANISAFMSPVTVFRLRPVGGNRSFEPNEFVIIDNFRITANYTNTINVSDVVVNEDAGTAVFQVTYDGPASSGTISVPYNTADNTAYANSDYQPQSGTLSFSRQSPGVPQFITVPLIDNNFEEDTETFFLNLGNSSDNTVGRAKGTATIIDNGGDTTVPVEAPLLLYDEFNGYYDYAIAGDSFRTSETNQCSIKNTSTVTGLTSTIPNTAVIEKAYLQWAHAGEAADEVVTFEGQQITADIVNKSNAIGLNTFGMVADVTSIIQGISDPSTNQYDFSNLVIKNEGRHCEGGIVFGGWVVLIFYTELTLPAVSINLYRGFDGQQNASTTYTLDNFYAIGSTGSKTTVLSWEGDARLANNESLTITNGLATAVNVELVGDGDNKGTTVKNPFNSTLFDNTVTPIIDNTTLGMDLDTYDISQYIAQSEFSVTTTVNVGDDFVMLNSVLLKVPSNLITGHVYEDINYPGNTGRDRIAASGVGLNNATIELYDDTNALLETKNTDASGVYSFGGMEDGNYSVRVVNTSVRSSRTGGDSCTSCVPIQTFRRNFAASSLLDIPNQIGGATPQNADVGAGTLTGAQTVSTISISSEGAVGLDFGFNFNTIVNTNRVGQGSLIQFIINSNNLGENGLDIEPHPNDTNLNPGPGQDVSIFMIPPASDPLGRTADAFYNNTNGYFDINMDNINFPFISASNTSVDGRTQTAYSGNTNSGNFGASGARIGVVGTPLPNFEQPEIQVRKARGIGNLFTIDASNTTIRNIAAYGNNDGSTNIRANSGSANKITENYIGANADGIAISNFKNGVFVANGTCEITNNYFVNADENGIRIKETNGTLIRNNYFLNNGRSECGNAIGVFNGTAIDIENNLIERSGKYGIFNAGGSQVMISQNSIRETNSSYVCPEDSAAVLSSTNNTQIIGNIINNNAQTGIYLEGATLAGNLISLNSIYANGTEQDGLGIDHGQDGVTINDNGDGDVGPNGLLNFPVFQSAAVRGNTLKISGWARPGAIIEIFLSDVSQGTALKGSNRLGLSQDYGEGQTYVATVIEGSAADLDTSINSAYNDADGNQDTTNKFSFNIPLPFAVPAGSLITATATLANSTSEFSSDYEVTYAVLITNRRITYRISPTFAATGRATGRKTTAIFPNNFEDGESNASFNISMTNTTANTIDSYQILIKNVLYATIPNPNFGNHTLQTYDNGDGTFNHLFTSTAPLAGNATRQILGGVPVPAGNGISCGCLSFYKL